MPRFGKILLSVLCAAVISGAALPHAYADTTDLPGGILIGDQDGLQVDKHGNYYIDERDIKPGDIIKKVISIQNLEENDTAPEAKIPFTVKMTAEAVSSSGPVNLLDTKCVMKLDGAVVFEGTVKGSGTPDMTLTPLNLGEYSLGQRRDLEIVLTIDPDADFGDEKSEADFRWRFYAARESATQPPKSSSNPPAGSTTGSPGTTAPPSGGTTAPPSGGTDTPGTKTPDVYPPYTGIILKYGGYGIPVAVTLGIAALLVVAKRRRENAPGE